MKAVKSFLLITLLSFSLVLPLAVYAQTTQITVVANSIDKPLFSLVENYLESNNFDIVYTTADKWEENKENSQILIIGGPDSPEGVGDIVQEFMTSNIEDKLREEKGNYGLYVYKNKYSDNQEIDIVAGFDRYDTRKAAQTEQFNLFKDMKNKNNTDIDDQVNLIINIEDINASYHTSQGQGEISTVTYTSSNIGNISVNSTIDLYVYYIDDGEEIIQFESDVSENWKGKLFKPNDNRYEILDTNINLPFSGTFAVELQIFQEGSSTPISTSRKEFTVH